MTAANADAARPMRRAPGDGDDGESVAPPTARERSTAAAATPPPSAAPVAILRTSEPPSGGSVHAIPIRPAPHSAITACTRSVAIAVLSSAAPASWTPPQKTIPHATTFAASPRLGGASGWASGSADGRGWASAAGRVELFAKLLPFRQEPRQTARVDEENARVARHVAA